MADPEDDDEHIILYIEDEAYQGILMAKGTEGLVKETTVDCRHFDL